MDIKPTVAITGITLALLASACSAASPSAQSTFAPRNTGGSTVTVAPKTPGSVSVASTVAAPPTTIPGAVDPNAPEVVAPGDIPDNQAFVEFVSADGRYAVKVPEGWARTEHAGVVTFTDKYNSIAVSSSPASVAPTVASVKATGLTDVSSDPTYTLNDVKPVTRKAGSGVLATYLIGSAPNPVTAKKALLAVERYLFVRNGQLVTMTLSGAKGADNVDPWRIVSDSLVWK